MSRPPLTINAWLRYDLIVRLLAGLEGVDSVLEVGAGEGALGVRLAERYRYVGLELDPQAFATARLRFQRAGVGATVNGDTGALRPAATFDLVCAFDVLEHCEDDAAALRAWRSRLRARGWLIVSVPAFAARFGCWDRLAGHYRRYERESLGAALAAGGFEPLSIQAYGFPLGNVLEGARNRVAGLVERGGSPAERTAASGRLLQPLDRLGALTLALAAPGRLLQRAFVDGDRGTGLVALARRS